MKYRASNNSDTIKQVSGKTLKDIVIGMEIISLEKVENMSDNELLGWILCYGTLKTSVILNFKENHISKTECISVQIFEDYGFCRPEEIPECIEQYHVSFLEDIIRIFIKILKSKSESADEYKLSEDGSTILHLRKNKVIGKMDDFNAYIKNSNAQIKWEYLTRVEREKITLGDILNYDKISEIYSLI